MNKKRFNAVKAIAINLREPKQPEAKKTALESVQEYSQKLRKEKAQKLKIKWSDLPIDVLRMCIAEGIYKPKYKKTK